ncbi:uncharacterized protein [Haliotis asinina]|uniref:uncharacterized protein n=1 Tax=Haliotis asinina TaxID=109174 RepID=UPI003531C172
MTRLLRHAGSLRLCAVYMERPSPAMDTESKCERPGQAHVRRMLHLSIWMLLLLFVLTSSTDTQVTEKVTVSKCIGEDAAFWWNYTVPPFHAIQCYFGRTEIATLEESHSQNFLKIINSYKHRFHLLLEKNRIGFNLTNVTKNDEGDYTCKLTLKSTYILVEQKGTLNVQEIIHGNLNIICDHNICTCGNPNSSGVYSWVFHDGGGRRETLNTNRSELNVTGIAKNRWFHCVRHSDCQRSGCPHFTSAQPCGRRRALDEDEPESGEEQPHTSGEEQPHTSDSPAHVHPAAVAVPLGLGVIFIVIVAVVIKRKDFPPAGNHGYSAGRVTGAMESHGASVGDLSLECVKDKLLRHLS